MPSGRRFGAAVPSELPWVICGDFNAIFSLDDKNGGPPKLLDIRDASSFLHDLSLFEPAAMGRRFTWSNGQDNPIWVSLIVLLSIGLGLSTSQD